ncbi:hypothetical protein Ancab_034989 [Ancistrocladus abbreviatus]
MGNGWVVVHDGKSFKFDDIVEYRGKLYGANRRGRAYRIDCDTLEMELIAASVQGGPGRRKRLVQAHEQLFLVMTCPLSGDMCKTKLKVYQLKDQNRSRKKEGEKRWAEIKSLDGQIFLLAIDFSFSFSAKELSGLCPGNCILFTANSFQNYNGPDDLCLFSVSSSMNLHIGVFNLETDRSIGPMDSHSCYSDLLWPPPAWLGPMKMSELIEALRAAIEGFCSRSKAAKDKDTKHMEKYSHSQAHIVPQLIKILTILGFCIHQTSILGSYLMSYNL